MTTTYRDLQATLKAYKADGVTLQCKLTANTETLQAEVTRIQNVTPTQPIAAIEPSPTVRIANNYLHYICLVLAYVYATIYISCQVTHRVIALTTLHIKAWYLIAVIKRTLADVTHNPQHGTT